MTDPALTDTSIPRTVLLDANVVIALTVADHEHHEPARTWLGEERRFATSPSSQGSLVRFLVRVASIEHAVEALAALASNPRHEFWSDDAPYDANTLVSVVGHRQVTDAYLAAIAIGRSSRVATFDRGFALLRPEATVLIPLG